jgi:prevent-host-death family protein
MKTHSLHEARADFSKLFEMALSGEPQRVTRYGKEAVVLVSETDWLRRPKTIPSLGSLLAQHARSQGFSAEDFERPFSQNRELDSNFD